MDAPLRAAVYGRISKDPLDTGLGVKRQLEDCRKLADLRHWQIDERWVLQENDTSATKGPRPLFERLLGGMESGAFDVVIVYKLDRLLRSMADMARVYEAFTRTGILFATADGQIDSSTDQGRASMILWGALAQIEIENLRGRVKRKAQQNREAGRNANGGSRSFGWELDRMTHRADEAAAIRDVAARIIDGASLSSMCRYLDKKGLLTPGRLVRGPDGKPERGADGALTGRVTGQARWLTPRLRNMLALPRHAGIVTYQGEPWLGADGAPVKAVWEPILDLDTHERLVAKLKGLSFTPLSWTNRRVHMMTGLVYCSACQSPLLASHAGERNGRAPVWYYRCRGLGCTGRVSRHRDLLEAYVLGEVVKHAADPQNMIEIAEWSSTEQEKLRSQIAEKRAMVADLDENFLANGGDAARLARLTSSLEADIERLEAGRLDELSRVTGADWASLDVAETLARSASLLATDVPGRAQHLDDQRSVVSMYVRGVVVLPAGRGRGFDPASVRIVWRDPNQAALRWTAVTAEEDVVFLNGKVTGELV